MEIQASSVSDIVTSIKSILESQFRDVTTIGEISNLSLSSAGHYYFTLSDDKSSISCALFKMDALRSPYIRKAKDGDKVLLRGPISVYAKRGTFQLLCKKIIPYGKGDLKAEFEFLKEKLKSQGLFDIEHKKSIPKLAQKIAVVTALGGAALQDFLNIMKRRTLWHNITIVPSVMQGDKCASSVIKALEKIETKGGFDVVVITRGGGSIEDLWAFNDERLVKMIYHFEVPIISAIGHQSDFTLTDYVSDLRCETPSAAAENLSQEQTQLKMRLRYTSERLRSHLQDVKNHMEKRLSRINPNRYLHLIKEIIASKSQRLHSARIDSTKDYFDLGNSRLEIDRLINTAHSRVGDKLKDARGAIVLSQKLITNMNPQLVLERGYSYVSSTEGRVISSTQDFDTLKKDEEFIISFKDGVGHGKRK